MNYVSHEFNGRENRLSLTAGALYEIYEKFGYTDSIVDALKLDENTSESWTNSCWLYALLSAQGELQRRALGYDHIPMITMEAVRRFAAPADIPGIKTAITSAIALGFSQTVKPSEEQEIDLVLRELELEEKKKEAGAEIKSFLSHLASVVSTSAEKKPCSYAQANMQT